MNEGENKEAGGDADVDDPAADDQDVDMPEEKPKFEAIRKPRGSSTISPLKAGKITKLLI